MRVRTLWFDQRALLAQDADAPERVGGPEAHALRDEAFAEATRKPGNPSPSAIFIVIVGSIGASPRYCT